MTLAYIVTGLIFIGYTIACLQQAVIEIRNESKEEAAQDLNLTEPVEPAVPELRVPIHILEEHASILKAIGFSAVEAKRMTKKIFKDNPNITQEEFIKEATK